MRKILFFLALSIFLIGLFIFRPWEINKEEKARLIDRAPIGDYIAKADLLSLAESLSKITFYYHIPFRDKITPNVLLQQAKRYGVDIQSPSYLFLDEDDKELKNFGILVSVTNKEKFRLLIQRLKTDFQIKERTFKNHKVYFDPSINSHLSYGDDWAVLYLGDNFNSFLYHIISGKHGSMLPRWETLCKKDSLLNDNMLICSAKKERLQQYDINEILFRLTNDSTKLNLTGEIDFLHNIPFSLRQQGPSYPFHLFSKHVINLHLNIDSLREKKQHPFYQFLKKQADKFDFSLQQFLSLWNGNIALRHGGIHYVKERYIETVFDENFNPVEVTKTKRKKVDALCFHLEINKNGDHFFNRLLEEGIITKDGNDYYFLFSPPLHLSKTDSSYTFYTGKYQPQLLYTRNNKVLWEINKARMIFTIDSLRRNKMFVNVEVHIKNWIEKFNRFK